MAQRTNSKRNDRDKSPAELAAAVHDATWSWTVKAMADLRRIADQANAASKTGSLDHAIEMRRIERKARDASLVIGQFFGETKS